MTQSDVRSGGMNPGMYGKMTAYLACQFLGFVVGVPLGVFAVTIWVLL